MYVGRTAATIIVTPQDEQDDPGLVERTLRACFQKSRGPVALSHFGAQWPCMWEEMGSALQRGLRLYGVLDWRQFATPSEQRVAHPFIEAYPTPWKDQDLVVGTTRYKSQILHDKKYTFNAPLFGYQPTIGDYPDVDAAFADGACVSWFGSLNMSQGATQQANTICLIPGIILGTMFVKDIMENHDWIVRSQQAHQPFPRQVPP